MRLRLYLDEDSMNSKLVRALRGRGVDVITAREAGMIGRNDKDHLEFAAREDRALYTFNIAHFCELHSQHLSLGKSHMGIILAQQQRYSVGDQMRRLLRLIAERPAEEMRNQVEFLADWEFETG